jgi:hypothetical protein
MKRKNLTTKDSNDVSGVVWARYYDPQLKNKEKKVTDKGINTINLPKRVVHDGESGVVDSLRLDLWPVLI